MLHMPIQTQSQAAAVLTLSHNLHKFSKNINIGLQPKDKEMFKNKLTNATDKEILYKTRKYLEFIVHIP